MQVRGGKRWSSAALLVLLLSPIGAPAIAEERQAGREIEEIVVVSTKRARGEAVQDIPIATTVVNADIISQNNMIDLIDVSRMVPKRSVPMLNTPGPSTEPARTHASARSSAWTNW